MRVVDDHRQYVEFHNTTALTTTPGAASWYTRPSRQGWRIYPPPLRTWGSVNGRVTNCKRENGLASGHDPGVGAPAIRRGAWAGMSKRAMQHEFGVGFRAVQPALTSAFPQPTPLGGCVDIAAGDLDSGGDGADGFTAPAAGKERGRSPTSGARRSDVVREVFGFGVHQEVVEDRVHLAEGGG
ncbi:hypothetical protein [Actinomadura sp. 21ATH]|uniref:hypothetical protein n=1 Tax=Actinomadura sp. 21ATH TaxID=1735444 RepID=UPI0035BFD682